ncbi:MAG TPA: alkaline phosphatase family protein [Steroidobacteraceae bacterium]|jgi:predicted AlkP superfamily phosphohydrolase/phosphomutase
MSARLLIIALDATDLCLLQRHIDAGRLPVIAGLRAHGRLQALSSSACATDAALWASFHYGTEIGEHGRYHDYLRLEDGRYGLAVQSEQQRDTIWDQLSHRGMRVAVFDLPKSRAPRPTNGLHLTDWLVHGRIFARPSSYPTELAQEVINRFGEAPPSRCDRICEQLTDAQLSQTLDHLRWSVSMKRRAALFYLARQSWDCFAVAFKEIHCCSHGFWNLIDPDHPSHDRVRSARLGDPSSGIFQKIDRAVGDLVTAAGPESELIVFSTSAFQANGSVDHLLPELIVQLNKFIWNQGAASLPPRSSWGVKMLSYNENTCALRLTCKSSASGVSPDDGRAATIQALEQILQRITDPDTGEAMFVAFHRPSSDHAGSRSQSLPDMLLVPRAGVFPQAAVSPELGRIVAKAPGMRPGNHRDGGFVIARGPAVEAMIGGVASLADLSCATSNALLTRPLLT